ncbi:MAG: hypothetical protein JF616_08075 [Fibrobacteres bacterium]|nr:hypothetical protein [Fibrobacterota bacterium]
MKKLLLPAVLLCLAAFTGCKDYHYVKVAQVLPVGKTSGLTPDERQADSLMKALVSNQAAVDRFQKMFKCAVLEIIDFDSLTFTVKINADSAGAGHAKAEYSLGTDPAAKPDLVLPIYRKNLSNLLQIFADNTVSDEEAYRIHRAVFGSSLRSLFQVPALYDPKIAKHLALPNFIQMTLKNEGNYEFMGSKKEAVVTIVNVDGQWLVTQGAYGDPEVKWAVTPKQLADFTRLVFEPGKGAATSMSAARARLKEIKAFIDGITVYRRG